VSSIGANLLTLVDRLARYGTVKQEAPGFSRGVAHSLSANYYSLIPINFLKKSSINLQSFCIFLPFGTTDGVRLVYN